MELRYNATVELSGGDVKKLIEDAVGPQMRGFVIKRVELEVGMEFYGFGMNEGQHPVFKGAKIHLAPKILGTE